MNRLDSIAMAILKGLMLRHKEQGYSDESAIHEAYRLAELVVAQKTAPNNEYKSPSAKSCLNCKSMKYCLSRWNCEDYKQA